MSKYFNFFKSGYDSGALTIAILKEAVVKGKLIVNDTVDEFKEITGQNYVA
jgi:hypothetical protein